VLDRRRRGRTRRGGQVYAGRPHRHTPGSRCEKVRSAGRVRVFACSRRVAGGGERSAAGYGRRLASSASRRAGYAGPAVRSTRRTQMASSRRTPR